LLDKSQDAILLRDLHHRILYWNKSAERRYGWTAAEAVGRSVRALIYDDATDLEIATAVTLARGEWVGELRQQHKDGSPVVVEGRWTLVRDDEGVPRSILAVNTDLTERKKLERTEEQLRQAQKMEAVGSLAGGVAHDFNNLLSVILSYTDLIIADLPPADPLAADLTEVRQAGLRATALTRQLLAFSRNQILEPVVLHGQMQRRLSPFSAYRLRNFAGSTTSTTRLLSIDGFVTRPRSSSVAGSQIRRHACTSVCSPRRSREWARSIKLEKFAFATSDQGLRGRASVAPCLRHSRPARVTGASRV